MKLVHHQDVKATKLRKLDERHDINISKYELFYNRVVTPTAGFWLTQGHKGLGSLEHQNHKETQSARTSSEDSVSNPLLSLPSISPSRQSRLPLLWNGSHLYEVKQTYELVKFWWRIILKRVNVSQSFSSSHVKQVFNQSSCCCIAFQRSIPFTLISLQRFNNASAYGRHSSLLRPLIASLRHKSHINIDQNFQKTIPKRNI